MGCVQGDPQVRFAFEKFADRPERDLRLSQICEPHLTRCRAAQTVQSEVRLEPWRDGTVDSVPEISRQYAAQARTVLACIDLELSACQNPSDARLIELYRAKDALGCPLWQADAPGRRAARLKPKSPQQPQIEPV